MTITMETTPCIFPVLTDNYANQGDQETGRIPIVTPSAQLATQNLRTEDLCSVFALAWALIVRRFTDMDVVWFGAHDMARNEDRVEQDAYLYRVSIDPNVTVRDALETDLLTLEQLEKVTPSSINTAVWFSRGIENPEKSDLISMRRCRDHHYDIVVEVNLYETLAETSICYRNTTISEVRAKGLAGNMAQILDWMSRNPMGKLGAADIYSRVDAEQIWQWNERQDDCEVDGPISNIILQYGMNKPNADAVHSWDGDLTYAELADLSSRLAAHLQALGVKPGDRLPLCMEKSLWAIVAVLAVIRTGAVFVPLEPTQPVQRIQSIITQVQANIVLASPRHVSSLQSTGIKVVSVSKVDLQCLTASLHTEPQWLRTDVAYILYTSGSTGSPKGCMMEHQGLVGFAHHAPPLHIQSNSRVLHFASYGVHASLVEIFCSLAAGATLCIPSEFERMNDLQGAINRMGVTWTLMTPSTLKTVDTRNLLTMETILLGAELIPIDAYEIFEGRFRLLIGYGMTEWGGILSAQEESERDTRNIGRAFLGKTWLVEPDNHNRLAPVGAVAELVIEGPFLARGYLDMPQITAETFLAGPQWLDQLPARTTHPTRLYKTGDLVQYTGSGTLRYLRRKDNQVKLRGFRIELGEVEHHLHRAWDSSGGDIIVTDVVTPVQSSATPALVAFIWCNAPSIPGGEQLDQELFLAADEQFMSRTMMADSRLRTVLPEHMIPSVYIPLSHVPMTFSRKVDRRALRTNTATLSQETLLMYRRGSPGGRIDSTNPMSITQRALHRTFALVLNMSPSDIGLNDSFYTLGGDSIGAMQLVSRCKAEDLPLTVEDLFDKETIFELAAAIDRNRLS